MTDQPPHEFGKRRPPPPAPISSQPTKRSAQVVLLVMGTLAVGAGAATLMPGNNCPQTQPGMATLAECQQRSSSSGGGSGGGSSRYGYYSGGLSSGSSSSGGVISGSSSVERGGFGSFARSFGMHFSGG